MKRGSHSSDAITRSLQHRISAFDLHPSAAVDIPSSLKYCCSPRAWATNLFGLKRSVVGFSSGLLEGPALGHEYRHIAQSN